MARPPDVPASVAWRLVYGSYSIIIIIIIIVVVVAVVVVLPVPQAKTTPLDRKPRVSLGRGQY